MNNNTMELTEADRLKLNAEFEKGYPQDILRWAVTTYGEKLAVVTSFQPTGIVTLHMLHELGLQVDILTLDTGLLFPETYALIEAIEQRFKLQVKRVKPALSVQQQAQQYGEALWGTQPDLCCHIRKVIPLDSVLVGYDAWIAGVRRDQGVTRAEVSIVGWDKRNQKVKIAPFANWTEEMLWTYINAYELPYNPLHDQDYPSIGCIPCTQPVASDAADKRVGRWANRTKTECGIHVS